jgi:hypothetical protein
VVRQPFPHLGDGPEWVEVARAELDKKYGKGKYGQVGGVVRTTMRPQLQAAARTALQAALRAVDARHKVGRPVRKLKPDKIADELARLGKKLPAGGPAKGESYDAVVTAVHDGDGELAVDLGGWPAAIVLSGPEDERYNPPGAGGARKKPSERFAVGDVVRVARLEVAPGRRAAQGQARAPGGRLRARRRGRGRGDRSQDPRGAGDGRRLPQGRGWAQPGDRRQAPARLELQADRLRRRAGVAPGHRRHDRQRLTEVYDLWRPRTTRTPSRGRSGSRHALAKSINTVAIKLLAEVGPDAAAELAAALGITGPLPRTLSLALGSGEVTPLELTNAYATFAAGGLYAPPRFVTELGGAPVPAAAGQAVMEPDVAYLVTDLMRSVVEQGTAGKARSLGVTIAGKTGTSNDARDTWFVGMTPDVVIGVWIGNDDNTPMGRGEAGGATALPAFIDTLRAMAPKDRAFPRPPGIVTADVDLATGLLAPPARRPRPTPSRCFLPGTAPTEVAPAPGQIDAQSFVTDEYGDEVPEAPGAVTAAAPVTRGLWALAATASVATAAPLAPPVAPDGGGVIGALWRDAVAELEAASAARLPPLVPPTPRPVRWKARRIASLDLGGPLLALAAVDLDGDRADELIALTEGHVIALGAHGAGLRERARLRVPAEAPAVRPREPIGVVAAVGAEVVARSSSSARGARYGWRDGRLVELAPVAGFPACADRTIELAGRPQLRRGRRRRAVGGAVPDRDRRSGRPRHRGGGHRRDHRDGDHHRRDPVRRRAARLSADHHRDPRAGRGRDRARRRRSRRRLRGPGHRQRSARRRRRGRGVAPDRARLRPKPLFRRGFLGGVVALAVGDVDGDGDREAFAAVRLVGGRKVDLWLLD